MPRKATPAPASKAAPINEGTARAQSQAADQLAVVELQKRDSGQGRDLINQLLGQAQMAGAFSEFSALVRTTKLALVKENKLYQQLSGERTPHGTELKGTWEEFCGLLGRSVDMVDRDIANVRAFGEEALEGMQRVGIGYRDLREFRKLPPDQKTALIEAAKSGDSETLMELAEDLIAKHTKEKTDLKQELAAKDLRISKHAARITALEDAADSFAALPVHEQVATSASRALGIVQGDLRQSFLNLAAHHKDHGGDGREVMAGYVAQMQKNLNELREEFMLTDAVGDGTPAWKRWAEKQAAGAKS